MRQGNTVAAGCLDVAVLFTALTISAAKVELKSRISVYQAIRRDRSIRTIWEGSAMPQGTVDGPRFPRVAVA